MATVKTAKFNKDFLKRCGPPSKKRKLQYDRDNLRRAFEATRKGISVYRAARDYSVPESTLRDRHLGLVPLECHIGFDSIFSNVEEQKLVNHITYMASIGYGYNKSSIQYMAWDYAKSLGKQVKAKESLSDNWFYGLLKRWPDLCVKKPQKLSIARAKSASREALNNYYSELGFILTINDLTDKPQCISNIDETGVNSEHSPPKIVCDKNTIPQNVTSSRSQTVTIIASGIALGNSIPPYYVFPGQRWNPEFLNDACPGSAGEMSKTGWSNTCIFENYLKNHFATYANLSRNVDGSKILILYDGHRSHTSLTLTDWAKKNNVILFLLPPHSSHVTQPLDVGVFGPFKSMYYSECQNFMKRNPGMNVTKYQIASLTSKPYLKALSAENLISAFRRTGIHPFDRQAIVDSQISPSTIYAEKSQTTQEDPQHDNSQPIPNSESSKMEDKMEDNFSDSSKTEDSFFKSRTITKPVSKPKRKFVPSFLPVYGDLHKKSVQHVLVAQANKTQQ
ncbi:uncharacterized protein LOC123560642 [Mercenaria mercenaria]|uniref:uncharacterized protein LOC123560642 n=1 Tax=Mercenaria mercenaria TaxID=6596 RepID=UPI00234EA405|nr:uncharacterized protein LOC123560642 [Mercenaria mercenaria]